MEDTVDKLLMPRKRVIIDYPDSPYTKGQIIKFPHKSDYYTGTMEWETEPITGKNGGKSMRCIKYFEDCPDCFEDVPWWSERTIDEMPEYVKVDSKVYKVVDYSSYRGGTFYTKSTNGISRPSYPLKNALPSTKEEYDQFINQTK